MGLEDWKDVIGNSATVFTIGMFLSGLEICAKFYRNKTTGDTSPMSFIVGVVMTFTWLLYGSLIGDSSLLRVNGAGFILQCLYTVIFCRYAVNRTNVMKKVLIASMCILFIYYYVVNGEEVIHNIGLLGATMSVTYCGAPLASIGQVIRTKSADVLPFYLILMTVIVTGHWTLYGMILNDPFVKIPNFLGFFIAVFQLGLFFYFPVNKSPPATKAGILVA